MRKSTLLSVVASVTIAISAGGQPPAPTLAEEVIAAFTKREKAAEWVKIRVKTISTLPKGLEVSKLVPGTFYPSEESVFEGEMALNLGPTKWRLSQTAQGIDSAKEKVVKRSDIIAFDGSIGKVFQPVGPRGLPLGIIVDASQKNPPQTLWAKALFLSFRPLQSGLVRKGALKITHEAFIGNRPCLVLETERTGNSRWTMWVAKSPEFAVLRYSFLYDGQIQGLCEFSYRDKNTFPEKWECTSLQSNGRLNERVAATVVELSVGKRLSDKDLELEFPKGTVVQDMRRKGIKKAI